MRKMAINLPLAPTFFCFTHQLAAEAICQHMNFVEEGSINKFILNSPEAIIFRRKTNELKLDNTNKSFARNCNSAEIIHSHYVKLILFS